MNKLKLLMTTRLFYASIGWVALLSVLSSAIAIFFFAEKVKALERAREDRFARVEQDVRAVLDRQVEAWNKGDLETFMTGYWKSPDLTFFSEDKVTSGWQQTIDRYRKRYQSEGREMGKLSFSDLRIKEAGDQMAWVRGRWKLVTSKETLGGLFTLIVERMPEGWRIVHDHTSAAPAEKK